MGEIGLECFAENSDCFILVAESETVDIGGEFSLECHRQFKICNSVL
jgi:hypothetical protein